MSRDKGGLMKLKIKPHKQKQPKFSHHRTWAAFHTDNIFTHI